MLLNVLHYSCFVGLKLFGKAHVEVNVSLGQLINNPLFNEAESEFHVSSYFKTKIDIRNALHVSLTYARHSEIVCRLFMYAFVTTLRLFSCCTTSAPTYLTPYFIKSAPLLVNVFGYDVTANEISLAALS